MSPIARRQAQHASVIQLSTERAFLAPLPLDRLPGVGPRTTAALQRFGVTMVGSSAILPGALLGPAQGTLYATRRAPD